MKFPIVGQLLKCSGCGRKILIERTVNGSDHTIEITAICWNCLSEGPKEYARFQYQLKEEEK